MEKLVEVNNLQDYVIKVDNLLSALVVKNHKLKSFEEKWNGLSLKYSSIKKETTFLKEQLDLLKTESEEKLKKLRDELNECRLNEIVLKEKVASTEKLNAIEYNLLQTRLCKKCGRHNNLPKLKNCAVQTNFEVLQDISLKTNIFKEINATSMLIEERGKNLEEKVFDTSLPELDMDLFNLSSSSAYENTKTVTNLSESSSKSVIGTDNNISKVSEKGVLKNGDVIVDDHLTCLSIPGNNEKNILKKDSVKEDIKMISKNTDLPILYTFENAIEGSSIEKLKCKENINQDWKEIEEKTNTTHDSSSLKESKCYPLPLNNLEKELSKEINGDLPLQTLAINEEVRQPTLPKNAENNNETIQVLSKDLKTEIILKNDNKYELQGIPDDCDDFRLFEIFEEMKTVPELVKSMKDFVKDKVIRKQMSIPTQTITSTKSIKIQTINVTSNKEIQTFNMYKNNAQTQTVAFCELPKIQNQVSFKSAIDLIKKSGMHIEIKSGELIKYIKPDNNGAESNIIRQLLSYIDKKLTTQNKLLLARQRRTLRAEQLLSDSDSCVKTKSSGFESGYIPSDNDDFIVEDEINLEEILSKTNIPCESQLNESLYQNIDILQKYLSKDKGLKNSSLELAGDTNNHASTISLKSDVPVSPLKKLSNKKKRYKEEEFASVNFDEKILQNRLFGDFSDDSDDEKSVISESPAITSLIKKVKSASDKATGKTKKRKIVAATNSKESKRLKITNSNSKLNIHIPDRNESTVLNIETSTPFIVSSKPIEDPKHLSSISNLTSSHIRNRIIVDKKFLDIRPNFDKNYLKVPEDKIQNKICKKNAQIPENTLSKKSPKSEISLDLEKDLAKENTGNEIINPTFRNENTNQILVTKTIEVPTLKDIEIPKNNFLSGKDLCNPIYKVDSIPCDELSDSSDLVIDLGSENPDFSIKEEIKNALSLNTEKSNQSESVVYSKPPCKIESNIFDSTIKPSINSSATNSNQSDCSKQFNKSKSNTLETTKTLMNSSDMGSNKSKSTDCSKRHNKIEKNNLDSSSKTTINSSDTGSNQSESTNCSKHPNRIEKNNSDLSAKTTSNSCDMGSNQNESTDCSKQFRKIKSNNLYSIFGTSNHSSAIDSSNNQFIINKEKPDNTLGTKMKTNSSNSAVKKSSLCYGSFKKIVRVVRRYRKEKEYFEAYMKKLAVLNREELIFYCIHYLFFENDHIEEENDLRIPATHKTIIGIILYFEEGIYVNIKEEFMKACEEAVLRYKRSSQEIYQIVMIYIPLCMLNNDRSRARRLICDALYFLQEEAIFLTLYVLKLWSNILYENNRDNWKGHPLIKLLIHKVYTQNCRKEILTELKDILFYQFNYPRERYNENELIKEFVNQFAVTGDVLYETCTLIICKMCHSQWTSKQIEVIDKIILGVTDEVAKNNLLRLVSKISMLIF